MTAQTMRRDEAIAVLSRLRLPDPVLDAERELPDPAPAEDLERFGIRHGLTKDWMDSHMGGSP